MISNKVTIYEILESTVKKYPNRIIYNFLGFERTYKDFFSDVKETQAYLLSIGLQAGDTVSICLPNIPRALVLFYALNGIGAVSNFIHPQLDIKEYCHTINQLHAKVLFILEDFHEQEKLYQDLSLFNRIIKVRSNEFMSLPYRMVVGSKSLGKKILRKGNYLKTFKSHGQSFNKDPYDVATILFSGGTSGKGKAILLSDVNMNTCSIQTSSNRKGLSETDSMLAILPMFHGYGLVTCIHTTVLEGGKIILLPYYSDRLFYITLRKYKPNYITDIPKLYHKMTELLDGKHLNLSFLKGVYSGGSKISDQTRLAFNQMVKDHNGHVTLQEGYGLTEIVAACVLMPENKHKDGSIGLPYPDTKAKIVHMDTFKEVQPMTLGRLAFQSEAIMVGYMNQEIQPFFYDNGEKWLYTDDLAYMDEENYIFFVDRIKRMIKISGYEVYPSKIEQMILNIKGISNTCLVEWKLNGISYLKLLIVIDKHIDKEEIIEDIHKVCEKNLPQWSRPKVIETIDDIPQTLYKKNDYKTLTKWVNEKKRYD